MTIWPDRRLLTHFALLQKSAGIQAHVVQLPPGHDPNSYFVAGAAAADFTDCPEWAQQG
jgi:hypothetical protein